MSIVQRIVRSHGGHVQVESAPGKGSKVCVLLPANSEANLNANGVNEPAFELIVGRGTVLVVDDEELVIKMSRSALQSFGFETEVAMCGEEALRRIRSSQDIDVLLLDATMPGASGPDTLKAIRDKRPDLPIVLTSGHHIDEINVIFESLDGITFLKETLEYPATIECVERSA